MIRVRIRTDSPERTLTRAVSKRFPVLHPKKLENGIEFDTPVFYYKALKRSLIALGKPYEVRFVGLSGIFWRYRRRFGLFVGSIITIFLFYLSTFFIWSVRIEGNGVISDAEVMRTLEAHGFHEGVSKSSFDPNELALEFLRDRSEFSFCSVNVNGVVAHVELVERRPTRYAESDKAPYNLVADTDGVIVRVEAEGGQSEVRAGDAVFKGQLLVSGIVENTATEGVRLARASGRVYARTWRTLEFTVPFRRVEKRYTGEKKASRIRILGHSIGFVFPPKNGSFDVVTSLEAPEVLGHALPFYVERILFAEYEEREVLLDEDSAKRLAMDSYRAWCSTELEGAITESEEFETVTDGECLTLICRLTAIEDIAKRQRIETEVRE